MMAKYFAWLMFALFGAACSGTTDTGTASGAGASAGGTSHSGGSASGGNVTSGGSGSADPRCPPKVPMGMCEADEADLSCQYDQFTGCLCYAPPGAFAYCQPVDTMCNAATGAAGNAGSGGGGGAATDGGAAGTGGFGGISAKVAAAPQHQVCSCSTGTWACALAL